MDEYIILRSGYNQAINDVLEVLDKNIYIDIENKDVLKDMILRRQKCYLNGQNEYEGSLYKYHDAVNKILQNIFSAYVLYILLLPDTNPSFSGIIQAPSWSVFSFYLKTLS